MHKILLTGSSGFIGSNILHGLNKKYEFYLIVRNKSSKKILKKKNIHIISFKDYNSLNLKLKKIKGKYSYTLCNTLYKKPQVF